MLGGSWNWRRDRQTEIKVRMCVSVCVCVCVCVCAWSNGTKIATSMHNYASPIRFVCSCDRTLQTGVSH